MCRYSAIFDIASRPSAFTPNPIIYKPKGMQRKHEMYDESRPYGLPNHIRAGNPNPYVFFFLCDFFGAGAGVGDLDSLISSSFCTSSKPRF